MKSFKNFYDSQPIVVESIINCADPLEAKVMLLGANYDKTSSFGKGADKGPKAIKKCLDEQIEFDEKFTRSLKIAYHSLGDLNVFSPEKMIYIVARNFLYFYDKEKFIITIGGEHSVSNGPFKALALRENPGDITIFQIDAHLDMRDTDADYNDKPWGKYAHSCVMRRGAELGFKTTQVGIRASSKDEYAFAEKHGSKVFRWGRGHIPSIDVVVNSIETEKVYVTIDVDGFDPSHMPATGTPVQGGIEWYYGLDLLKKVFKEKDVVATDIVEVAPRPHDHLTEYGAAQIVYNMITWKFGNEKKIYR